MVPSLYMPLQSSHPAGPHSFDKYLVCIGTRDGNLCERMPAIMVNQKEL